MLPEQGAFFESLFLENFPKLYFLASKNLQDPSGAEEVVHDTFVTALEKCGDIQQMDNPTGYLIGILKKKIHEYNRARGRYFKFLKTLKYNSASIAPAPFISYDEILKTAQSVLTEEDWFLFQRYFVQGFHHTEIAKEMHISVWASQKRLERIRKKLQEILPED